MQRQCGKLDSALAGKQLCFTSRCSLHLHVLYKPSAVARSALWRLLKEFLGNVGDFQLKNTKQVEGTTEVYHKHSKNMPFVDEFVSETVETEALE